MYNKIWSRKELTRQKLGTFGEYYAKMSLASYGMSIYTAEVDDHGIDFVAETANGFMKFQVKTIREGTNYVFMREKDFDIRDEALYLLLLVLKDGEAPNMYVIPATAWMEPHGSIFVYHAFEGKKSSPEYGLNLSKKNMPQLDAYRLEKFIGGVCNDDQSGIIL